jgi:hypothetical protein
LIKPNELAGVVSPHALQALQKRRKIEFILGVAGCDCESFWALHPGELGIKKPALVSIVLGCDENMKPTLAYET